MASALQVNGHVVLLLPISNDLIESTHRIAGLRAAMVDSSLHARVH
ncbi:hypothetical protein [Stenotrophomonas humi]